VFTHGRPQTRYQLFRNPVKKQLLDIEIFKQEVLQFLIKIKIDKSLGLDGFHPRVFKEYAVELAWPLATLSENTTRRKNSR